MRVGVVGATGLVGRKMLEVLEQRTIGLDSLRLFASARTAGEKVSFRGEEIVVEEANESALRDLDFVLMSAGGAASGELSPLIAKSGATVIDNSSRWRMDPDVPLVVPEINWEDAKNGASKGIIANPNCSTIQMVIALNPLHQAGGLRRVVVSTYQAVSGAGKAAVDELSLQNKALVEGAPPSVRVLSKQIALNCIPMIDVLLDDDYTKEERKMREETRKIMHVPEALISATCVRVPVFNGHAEAVTAEFEKPIEKEQAYKLWEKAPGVKVIDNPGEAEFATQVDCDGSDLTYVSRVRRDNDFTNVLHFWCVSDNLRKGAATNAVQILERFL